MSSVNRVLKKRNTAINSDNETTTSVPLSSNTSSPSVYMSQYDSLREKQLQPFAKYSHYNPSSLQFSNIYLPASSMLNNKYVSPLSCFINPINDELQYIEQSAQNIPRCSSCRAFMTYYNQISSKGFKCFICGRENYYQKNYNSENGGIELMQPNYLVDGPAGIYQKIPAQSTLIFMIDISSEAFSCHMLNYLITVLKDVLMREELNNTKICFYTFDETIHQYDFSRDEVQQQIIDLSIQKNTNSNVGSPLYVIRNQLFNFLDLLEGIAAKNTKNKSNFMAVFDYVYQSIKKTKGKLFIFQANDSIIKQSFMDANFKTMPTVKQFQPKNLLQCKNKMFFNKFVVSMLENSISMGMFIFGKAYKNILAFSDTCKITNSQLMYYSKDCSEQLIKFYYDLYAILGSSYYIDTRIELIISQGWKFTAVYGNMQRMNEYITYKCSNFQTSKRICTHFIPLEGNNHLPYFSMQVISNYIYDGKHYMAVNTAVLPLTTRIDRLFENINLQLTTSSLIKGYISSIRLEQITSCKNKYMKQVGNIWKAVNGYYRENLPVEWRNTFLSYLSFLKNPHTQIDLLGHLDLQIVISHRNLLQSCNYPELINHFQPYLFDLSTIGNDRCLEQKFIYPNRCELKFNAVKEGLFLMDAGYVLYLYFGYCLALFGRQKLIKTDKMSQELLNYQNNSFCKQLHSLIKVLRQRKTYRWVPLYIVNCGENTIYQRNFYLNFYEEKYQQFRCYNLNLQEFTAILVKQS